MGKSNYEMLTCSRENLWPAYRGWLSESLPSSDHAFLEYCHIWALILQILVCYLPHDFYV